VKSETLNHKAVKLEEEKHTKYYSTNSNRILVRNLTCFFCTGAGTGAFDTGASWESEPKQREN